MITVRPGETAQIIQLMEGLSPKPGWTLSYPTLLNLYRDWLNNSVPHPGHMIITMLREDPHQRLR